MAITYMQRRRSGVYEFRRMLPKRLAGKPAPEHLRAAFPEVVNLKTGCFKRELTVSLRTSDAQLAKRRDLREAVRVADLMTAVESAMADAPHAQRSAVAAISLAEIESRVLSDLLRRDDEERSGDDRRRMQTSEEREEWPDLVRIASPNARHMEEDHFHVYGDVLEEMAADYKSALARRDPRIVEPELAALLRKLGVTAELGSAWYHDAGLAILRAHVKAYGLKLQRQQGEDVPTPAAPTIERGPKLSEALASWKAGSAARGSRRPSDRTLLEARYAVRRFTELHGDLSVSEITREKARSFRDALAKTPTRLPERLRRLPLPKLLESKELAALPSPHAATVNKSITLLAAIISHAEREGHTDNIAGFANPFGKGLKLVVSERNADGREPFTHPDLAAIFSTGVYARNDRPRGGGGEAAFWLPVIALLSGARQGELAQLRVNDLAQDAESGVWHFDISGSDGRSLKTAASRRKVPVHPELIRMGLLNYRDGLLAKAPHEALSLWPESPRVF